MYMDENEELKAKNEQLEHQLADYQAHLEELKKQLDDLNKEKFNLRFQASNGQLSNTGRVKEVRRGIAKIKTILNKVNEKE